MYVLDSDSVTLFLHHKRQQPRLVRRVLDVPAEQMWVSIITVKEAIGGAMALIDNPRRAASSERDCAFPRSIMRDQSCRHRYIAAICKRSVTAVMAVPPKLLSSANVCKSVSHYTAHSARLASGIQTQQRPSKRLRVSRGS